jgi:hypothetical protein
MSDARDNDRKPVKPKLPPGFKDVTAEQVGKRTVVIGAEAMRRRPPGEPRMPKDGDVVSG